MVAECFFCGGPLPDADPAVLEPGERIAFDPELGRLWCVCGQCRRWNLAPFEARWEIVDRCEELARASKTLLASEHLTLFACGPGQLIRVGGPVRSEFAEWRYSSRLDDLRGFGGRIRRALFSMPDPPIGGYNPYGTLRSIPTAWLGSPFIEQSALLSVLFLNVPLTEQCPSCKEPLFIHPAAFADLRFHYSSARAAIVVPCGLCGDEVLIGLRDARPALRAGLALVSHKYRRVSQIERAVTPLDRIGGAYELVNRLCTRSTAIGEMPKPARLALWIALDELAEAEALEAQWRAAEILARIADRELTFIPGFDEFRMRVLSETPR